MIKKLLVRAILALGLLLPLPVQAGLFDNKTAQVDLKRVENYLNARRSFSARFIQIAEGGQAVTGNLLVSRPGKMNLTYDPPLKDFIVADGSFVYLWDGEMQHSTTIPISGSLAGLILRANLKLSGDVEVVKTLHESNRIEVAVRQKNDPDQGTMTLLFEDEPLNLRGWRITDSQNRTTTVTLQDLRENVAIAENSFTFTPPSLGRSGKIDKPINR